MQTMTNLIKKNFKKANPKWDLTTFTLYALSSEPEPEDSKSKPAQAQKILRHQSPSQIPKLRDRQGIFQSRIEIKGRHLTVTRACIPGDRMEGESSAK